jgi:ribosomal protein S8
MFVIMNFRVSIKQTLARIQIAEKKKDLKVNINFKKELIPFLVSLRKSGIIYKFIVKKKIIVLSLKKINSPSQNRQIKRPLRDFDLAAILYKNPATLIFLSTTEGIFIKNSIDLKKKGGTPLFLTY